jgi:hypothetical protein
MKYTKDQLIFLNLMKPFIDNHGCEIKFNPTRVIMPDGVELYKSKENDI